MAIGGALLVVVAVILTVREPGTPARPAASAAAAGMPADTPPDLSTMSPRERFDRLYNRVMQASEAGDAATVSQFTPMALAAYAGLDVADADARYHAAMLRLHTGDPQGAAALADSILADEATHLFGWLIRGALARFEGNQPAIAEARRQFLAAYDREMNPGRPEYGDHRTALERFKAEATP